jgi:hypothetical protein
MTAAIQVELPRSHGALSRVGIALWRNIGFIGCAAALAYSIAGAFDPPRLNWGDSGSDYNVMAAGRNFQRYGFLKLRLTPNLLDRSVWVKGDSTHIYTHYPQLPELANGAYRAVLGISRIEYFRLIALAFSFASFFFIYRLICIYWSRQTAQVALALWVSNPLWLQHADYLHNGPYGMFFGYGCIYFLARSLQEHESRAWLLASGAFLFLTYCSSYDYWIYAPLLLATITAAHFGGLFRRDTIRTLTTLAAFAVVAIVCKAATVAWALGGMHAFLNDLFRQGIEHAQADFLGDSYVAGVWPTLIGRVERYFSLLLIPLALAWCAMPWIRKRWAGRPSVTTLPQANPVVLLLAAIPFLCAFRELWVAQYYPFLMIVPFYAVGFAAAIVALIGIPRRSARAIGFIMLLAVSYSALDEDVRFKKAFFDPAAIRTLQAQLSAAPPGQRVYVNHVFDAAYRYYFDRNVFMLIPHESYRVESVIDFFSDPRRSPYPHPEGMLFVQDKHLKDEVFDKGYYTFRIFGHYGLWDAWANPPAYRRFLDSLVVDRDSALMAHVAKRAQKVYESDFYTLWRMNPVPRREAIAAHQPM